MIITNAHDPWWRAYRNDDLTPEVAAVSALADVTRSLACAYIASLRGIFIEGRIDNAQMLCIEPALQWQGPVGVLVKALIDSGVLISDGSGYLIRGQSERYGKQPKSGVSKLWQPCSSYPLNHDVTLDLAQELGTTPHAAVNILYRSLCISSMTGGVGIKALERRVEWDGPAGALGRALVNAGAANTTNRSDRLELLTAKVQDPTKKERDKRYAAKRTVEKKAERLAASREAMKRLRAARRAVALTPAQGPLLTDAEVLTDVNTLLTSVNNVLTEVLTENANSAPPGFADAEFGEMLADVQIKDKRKEKNKSSNDLASLAVTRSARAGHAHSSPEQPGTSANKTIPNAFAEPVDQEQAHVLADVPGHGPPWDDDDAPPLEEPPSWLTDFDDAALFDRPASAPTNPQCEPRPPCLPFANEQTIVAGLAKAKGEGIDSSPKPKPTPPPTAPPEAMPMDKQATEQGMDKPAKDEVIPKAKRDPAEVEGTMAYFLARAQAQIDREAAEPKEQKTPTAQNAPQAAQPSRCESIQGFAPKNAPAGITAPTKGIVAAASQSPSEAIHQRPVDAPPAPVRPNLRLPDDLHTAPPDTFGYNAYCNSAGWNQPGTHERNLGQCVRLRVTYFELECARGAIAKRLAAKKIEARTQNLGFALSLITRWRALAGQKSLVLAASPPPGLVEDINLATKAAGWGNAPDKFVQAFFFRPADAGGTPSLQALMRALGGCEPGDWRHLAGRLGLAYAAPAMRTNRNTMAGVGSVAARMVAQAN